MAYIGKYGDEEIGVSIFLCYIEVLNPLHQACLELNFTLDRTYLEKITMHCRTNLGWTAAHVAVAMSWHNVLSTSPLQKFINAYDQVSGLTPLRIAIKEKDEETINFLLKCDSLKALERDEEGDTVLHICALFPSKNILASVLGHVKDMVDINAVNNLGQTALHIACRENALECVEILLENGANPLIGSSAMFPIHLAVQIDSLECVNLLYDYCPQTISVPDLDDKNTPLHLTHNDKIFQRLCELGADLDAVNNMGLTVIHTCVRDNDLNQVMALLIRGANPNIGDIEKATPLHYAITYNASVHVVRALIVFDADVGALNNNQHSARHLLCRHSESYVHSEDRDLILYTLDAVGSQRCSPNVINCTKGCINSTVAKTKNITLFNGIPPKVTRNHTVDATKEVIEDVLFSATSFNLKNVRLSHQKYKRNKERNYSMQGCTYNKTDFTNVLSRPPVYSNQAKYFSQTPKLQRQFSVSLTNNLPIMDLQNSDDETPTFLLNSDENLGSQLNILESTNTSSDKLNENHDNEPKPFGDSNHRQSTHKFKSNETSTSFAPSQCSCNKSFLKKLIGQDDEDVRRQPGLYKNSKVNTNNSTTVGTEDSAVGDYSSDNDDEVPKVVITNTRSSLNTRLRPKRSTGHKWNCGPCGYRVLSLDGGGIRGLVIVLILRALEKITGRSVNELFDWIIGTSTGGSISLFVASGKCLHCCQCIMFRFSEIVFCGKRPYSSENLEWLLRNEFGDHTVMTDLKHLKVAVTSVVSDRCPPALHLFRNYKSPRARIQNIMAKRQNRSKSMVGQCILPTGDANFVTKHKRSTSVVQACDPDVSSMKQPNTNALSKSSSILNFFVNFQGSWTTNDAANNVPASDTDVGGHEFEPIPPDSEQLIWKAARASSAAPTFFRSCGRFLDGGLMSNNPTLDILTEIQELHVVQRLQNKPVTPIAIVVSIGTGRTPVYPVETVDVFRPQNFTETYRSMLGVRFLGSILVEIATMCEGPVVDRARAWCASLGVPYFRLNAPLSLDTPLDCTDLKELLQMSWEVKAYIYQSYNRLEILASLL